MGKTVGPEVTRPSSTIPRPRLRRPSTGQIQSPRVPVGHPAQGGLTVTYTPSLNEPMTTVALELYFCLLQLLQLDSFKQLPASLFTGRPMWVIQPILRHFVGVLPLGEMNPKSIAMAQNVQEQLVCEKDRV